MQHIAFIAALLAAAAAFARLEIEIEGADGWAASLPTWKIDNRWTRMFFGSRPLTGYHLYVHIFILVLVHAPFALSLTPLGWQTEARVLSFLILFWIVEDFLWFVFNPAFGLSRFRRRHIWWHAPSWWWFMPREYWIFLPIGVGLYLVSLPA